jgi:serine protease inhibitor
MQSLMEWLTEKSGSPELTLANSFFYDDRRIFVKEQFFTNLNEYFEAPATNYDFSDPATLDKINNWVFENTNQKIDEIVETIEPEDLAFLINALHFKADWSQGFDPDLTTDEPFFTSDGREVMAPFVFDDRQFMTVRTENEIMVDIPFRDSTYSLSLVMNEDPNVPISDWASQIDFQTQMELYETLSEERAIVRFPLLDLSFETDLPNAMRNLGMIDAFSEFDANFDALGEALIGPVIYINQLKHKAVLEVDEKGAEGAAVTSIGFGTTSLPPSYTFNRPFMLQLRHIPTNTIVFKGIVQNPLK